MQKDIMRFIALDFDGTCAHFDAGGSRGWFSIFVHRGIPKAHLEDIYRRIREQGFSIKNFLDELQTKIERELDRQEICREFEQWLGRSLSLYTDVIPAIQEWQKAGIPIFVLSAGEPEYQMQKIKTSGIPYDRAMLMPQPLGKAEVFKKLLGVYGEPAIIIDDRSDILDETRRMLQDRHVITAWIQRPGSEYAHGEAKFFHIKADSLNAPQVRKVILGERNG
ncbi:MAG: hypothetical protein Q8P55_01980 [bacterium]|nr:hypothetical protein [bacterium]